MGQRVKLRRDTAANWSSTNPVLADGEGGYDKTNKLLKIGDGSTAWNSLTAIASSGSFVYPVGYVLIDAGNTNPNTFLGYGTWAAFGAGRVLVGLDAAQTEFDTLGETGGEKTHVLTTGEMPAHTHGLNAQSQQTTSAAPRGLVGISGVAPTVVQTASIGGGAAHNILQPYIVVNFWKRTA